MIRISPVWCCALLLAACIHEESRPTPESLAAADRASEQRREAEAGRGLADCDVAKVTGDYQAAMACAAAKRALGDAASAITWWQTACAGAKNRDEACVPVLLIYDASPQPSRDLGALDPVLVQACVKGARDERDAKMVTAQQEQACEITCENSRSACIAGKDNAWAIAGCNIGRRDCLQRCRTRYR